MIKTGMKLIPVAVNKEHVCTYGGMQQRVVFISTMVQVLLHACCKFSRTRHAVDLAACSSHV